VVRGNHTLPVEVGRKLHWIYEHQCFTQ